MISSSPASSSRVEPVQLPMFSVPLLGYVAYSLVFTILAMMKIIKVNAENPIRVIYSVETGYGGLAAVLAAKTLRTPVVIHSHTRRSELLRSIRQSLYDRRTWIYWAFERFIDHFVLLNTRKAIAVSKEVELFLKSLGHHDLRVLVVPSVVEFQETKHRDKGNLRLKRGLSSKTFVVGYLGRLERMKGVRVLLDAYQDFVQRSDRDTLLLIAGDGPDRHDLEAIVQSRRLKDVTFLGFQSDVWSFLDLIDVFVLPSFHEGSPITLLEAMSTGCSIVASGLPGVTELARGCALLFHPGDVQALSDALLRLENDPLLRNRLGLSAKKTSLEYSPDKIFPRILDFTLDGM